MAYFLKKTKLKNRTYLSIVESYYSHDSKDTKHRTFKSLKSVESLIAQGMDDPISFYQNEVDRLNHDKNIDKALQISERSPKRFLGYFPLKAILNQLHIKKYIDFFKLNTKFSFDLYSVLSLLIFSRCVKPCSKYKTYYEVIPYLTEPSDFSYDQLLEALAFFGCNYEKIVELFTAQIHSQYSLDTSSTYFDCTNFYFEIDRENDFQRKGPSKENKKSPIIGLGLLLDAHQIPIGMKMYPGNESEKPIIRNVISDLKEQNNIEGKTIQVADKGLNCARNIYEARTHKDGYLFSKSVKQLPDVEKTWVLLENDYIDVKDGKGKVLYRYKECVDTFPYEYVDDNNKKVKFKVKEKRVVTYNPTLAKKHIYEINKMVEKARTLCLSKAKKEEYGESSKYVNFKGASGEKAIVTIDEAKIEKDKQLAGYNLLVTSEVKMKAKDIYDTYHNLWRIEESFKIMKSDLDARPAFMKTENTIKGHFLICYLTVVLERIFQFKILNDQFPSEAIFKFLKEFEVVKADGKYINITSKTDFITSLKEITNLPLTNYLLTEQQLKKVINYKF